MTGVLPHLGRDNSLSGSTSSQALSPEGVQVEIGMGRGGRIGGPEDSEVGEVPAPAMVRGGGSVVTSAQQ